MYCITAVFYPAASEDGVRFCVVCGKHGKFRLDRHLSETHRVPKRSELYEHLVQQPPAQQRPPHSSTTTTRRPSRGVAEAAAIVDEVEEAAAAAAEEVVVEAENHVDRREAGEGRAMEEDHRPATRQGPSIPREQLCLTVTVAEDRLYRGGPKPHPAFLEAPYKTLMFAHEMDVWREEEDYYVQTFTIPPNQRWMHGADAELKLWRKLVKEQHPDIEGFCGTQCYHNGAGNTLK
ncbi:hypothetical protein COOONC_12312 [Cooperia oncophora]